MRQFIVYYRVSTKKQGRSGLGLEAQKAYVEHFIDQKSIVKEYTEVASAKYMDCKNRPQLCEAMRDCKKYGYTLVVAKIDRLSRTTEHALDIYNQLEGQIVSCDIPNLDKFTLTIFMAIADRERQLISVRTKAALKAKKQRGDKLGKVENFTSEGRKKGVEAMKEKALNNKNNMRAMEVASMYREKGYTLEQVAKTLNSNGFKTSRGKKFQKTTVSRLIKRYKALSA